MIRMTRKGAAAVAVLALAAGAPELAYASPGQTPAPPGSAPAAQQAEGTRPAAQQPGARQPGGKLPEGWRITGAGADRHLVWTAPERVPMGDARVEFHAGDRVLGAPAPDKDQRTFRLPLGSAEVGPDDALKVLAGGRRLDQAGKAEAAERAPRDRRGTGPAPQAANPAPANPVDPGTKGRYRTVSGDYTLPSVKLPDFPRKVEMTATVVGPKDAPGKRPVALFLHGRHSTCYNAQNETGSWPCDTGFKPIPSHKGYLHDQRLLASQGYVTVSISANGINGQDHSIEDAGAQARSSLVRQHLARLAGWSANPASAPAALRKLPRADLDKVLLVGHSRGGEGVNRAALDSRYPAPADRDGYKGPVRWKIRGTVLIGPTIFGQNPAPDVPSVTLLPGCDGDVSDLQGQIYADGTRAVSRGKALQSSVYMVGANHNFFNTEWTPGQAVAPAWDDWDSDDTRDAVCAPGTRTRLTAKQQQTAGSTYIAAAARLFVVGDDKVRPLLDGSNRRAPSAGPAQVRTHAVGGNRVPAVLPSASTKVTGGRLCAQIDPDPAKACLPLEGSARSPHFAFWETAREPGRHAVAMNWNRAGTPLKVTPAKTFSVKGSESLALRVIVPQNSTGTKLDVRLTDAAGRKAHLGQVRIDGIPGTDRTTSAWAREVRVPLKAAVRAGLDLRKAASLELTPRTGSGKAWLMDAWGWRPGTPAAGTAKMPRVDLGRLTVKEGDSGSRTFRVPVKITGHGSGQVRVFVQDAETGATTARTVTVKPGSQAVDVPITVEGNTRFAYDSARSAFVKAVRGVAVGAHSGGVLVRNDDPMPKISVAPVADKVTEGQALSWRVKLSEAADVELYGIAFKLLPATGGTELSTRDVDPTWLDAQFGTPPTPEVPLSRLWEGDAYLPVMFAAGALTADVTVPTVTDSVAETDETLRLQEIVHDAEWNPIEGDIHTGTVRDTP
ncbi:hypothetical protein [Streptomyces uncialis]|uniref:hypothetical protein n=1 Tax=Streptomyces uncialis TaxID=1048205 RepID=UPI003869EE43